MAEDKVKEIDEFFERSVEPSTAFINALATKNLTALHFSPLESPFQYLCEPLARVEQGWLKVMTEQRHKRQSPVEYGVFESSQTHLEAMALEFRESRYACVAISSGALVTIHSFFMNAFARPHLLTSIGDPSGEQLIITDANHVYLPVVPHDQVRREAAFHCIVSAVRFISAHELTHIVNGHLRLKLKTQSSAHLTEKSHQLDGESALQSQTLEMDADCGAVIDCIPFILDRYSKLSDEELLSRKLHLWLYSVYCCFVLMDLQLRNSKRTLVSHPDPLMRLIMIVVKLGDSLEKYKYKALLSRLPDILKAAVQDGDQSFHALFDKSIWNENRLSPILDANVIHMTKIYGRHLLRRWISILPELEPLSTRATALAPAQVELLRWPYSSSIQFSMTR